MRQIFYYKMRQFYYKMQDLLQNVAISLQNATVIARCDVCYKMCHYIGAIDKAIELSSVMTI